MKENVVERRLKRKVEAAGGQCHKFFPVVRGYPDRIIMLPWGRIFFVETKAPNGELRPSQRVFIDRAAAIGVEVAVLYTVEQVDAWITARINEGPDGCSRLPRTAV